MTITRNECEARQICATCAHFWSGTYGIPVCNNSAVSRNRRRKEANDTCGLWEIGYDAERRDHRDFVPEYERSQDDFCH